MNDARVPEADTAQAANLVDGGASPSARSIQQLEGKLRTLKRQVTYLQQALHDRNLQLDAMHYVWCDGGCKAGTHRFTPGPITEEVVAEAERNSRRLRTWFNNHQLRLKRGDFQSADRTTDTGNA